MPLQKRIKAEDFVEAIDQWADEIIGGSFEKPLRECLPILHENFEDHFIKEQAPYGTWPARKYSYPWPILIKTGNMLEAARDTGNPGNLCEVTAHELQTGVKVDVVKYAGFQQYGTSKLPPRPYVWADDATIDACEDAFAVACFKMFVLSGL